MNEPLEAYIACIGRHAPTLSVDSVRLDRDGLANDVVIVNEELVFRFAKTDAAKAQVGYEVQVLDLVRQHVSLAIPVVEDRTDDYVLYRFLDGRPLYRHVLLRWDDAAQERCLADLATFLQQLHAIPLSKAPRPLWEEELRASRQQRYLAQLAEIESTLFPLLWADQKAYIYDLFAPLQKGALDLDAFSPVFIHRDLASYHILHDPETRRLTGIIDFGTAGPGDAAVDYGTLHSTYGESLLRLLDRFSPLAQEVIDRARFQAAYLELEWALNGIDNRDPEWLLVHLGRARDGMPIGTAWRRARAGAV